MGSKEETRNDLSLYHPELNFSSPSSASSPPLTLTYPALYQQYPLKMRLPSNNLYPNDHRPIVIGMAVSNAQTHPSAGDIFTAKELGNSLSSLFDVKIEYLARGPGWYVGVRKVDIVVAFLDQFDVSQIKQAKPSLVVVAWMRNWFHRWLSRKWIGNFDLLLMSSSVASSFFRSFSTLPVQCHQRCPPALALHRRELSVQVGTLRIATNPRRFSPGPHATGFHADYVFTGNYWDAPREFMSFNPQNLSEFKGVVIGANWHRAPVSEAWLDMVHGEVPYRLMPEIYRSSKIVIDDANHVTKPWGSVNSRVFDALACGTLVLTNGVLGSQEAFHLQLPTYSDMDDLTAQLRYFLTHEEARIQRVKQLQVEVLRQHTYRNRAEQFALLVNDLLRSPVLKPFPARASYSTRMLNSASITATAMVIRPSETVRGVEAEDPPAPPSGSVDKNRLEEPRACVEEDSPAICVGVRTYMGERATGGITLLPVNLCVFVPVCLCV